MARTMQELSEGIFINMANLTLAHRDSYLDYLRAGVKQDTLIALCTAPLHMNSLFPDQSLAKAVKRKSLEMKKYVPLVHHKRSPVATTLRFFKYQFISQGGPEVWCTCLEANQGETTEQERTWQGLNLPAETG